MSLTRYSQPLLYCVVLSSALPACDGCSRERELSAAERTKVLASAIAAPAAAATSATPSASSRRPGSSLGHAANVVPGQGPNRIEAAPARLGHPYPILPGQGIGPIRFGANRATIERLMGAPCEDATETLCRYVSRAVEFKLDGGVATEMRVFRKGREAKRAPDGSIIEFGFYNGVILPDVYFGMHPQAVQEALGQPQKLEKVDPMGLDGLSERHIYDGIAVEYDRWSNGNLVLGAAVITKSDTAAAANEKAELERARKAAAAASAPRSVQRRRLEPH